MEEFISYLVKNVVNDPEKVEIRSLAEHDRTLIEIRVAPDDVGKVVGKKGMLINSLRILAANIGARLGRRVQLEIIQP